MEVRRLWSGGGAVGAVQWAQCSAEERVLREKCHMMEVEYESSLELFDEYIREQVEEMEKNTERTCSNVKLIYEMGKGAIDKEVREMSMKMFVEKYDGSIAEAKKMLREKAKSTNDIHGISNGNCLTPEKEKKKQLSTSCKKPKELLNRNRGAGKVQQKKMNLSSGSSKSTDSFSSSHKSNSGKITGGSSVSKQIKKAPKKNVVPASPRGK